MDVTVASEAPVSAASIMPVRNIIKAVPIPSEPEAQAEATEKHGPLIPNSMAVIPAPPFAINIGIRNGLTRRGPSRWFVKTASCNECKPPIAEEMITPIRPEFASVISNPDCAKASLADAIVNCSKRSRRRASFASIKFSGLNPFTSAAICTCKAAACESNSVIGATPDTPAITLLPCFFDIQTKRIDCPHPCNNNSFLHFSSRDNI